MPGKKKSAFLRKPVKVKKRPVKKPLKTKPVKKAGSLVPQALTEASSLLHLLQRMLDGTFAPANPVIKGYLQRAASEVQDLLKQLTSTLGGTPNPDTLEIATASGLLLEAVLASDNIDDADVKTLANLTKRLNKD